MFTGLTVRGGAGTLLWGYHPAATLTRWSIAKVEGQWTLVGRLARADAFMCRQKGLLFTAPHEGGRDGFWAWAVLSLDVGTHKLVAKLGPPEQ